MSHRGRQRRRAIATASVLIVTAAACSSGPPTAFRDRPKLAKCGTVALPEGNLGAVGCFRRAVERNLPAEIHYTSHTAEGDLTESWVQFVPRSSARLYLHSNDRFGERGWTWCSGPITAGPTVWTVQCQPVKLG